MSRFSLIFCFCFCFLGLISLVDGDLDTEKDAYVLLERMCKKNPQHERCDVLKGTFPKKQGPEIENEDEEQTKEMLIRMCKRFPDHIQCKRLKGNKEKNTMRNNLGEGEGEGVVNFELILIFLLFILWSCFMLFTWWKAHVKRTVENKKLNTEKIEELNEAIQIDLNERLRKISKQMKEGETSAMAKMGKTWITKAKEDFKDHWKEMDEENEVLLKEIEEQIHVWEQLTSTHLALTSCTEIKELKGVAKQLELENASSFLKQVESAKEKEEEDSFNENMMLSLSLTGTLDRDEEDESTIEVDEGGSLRKLYKENKQSSQTELSQVLQAQGKSNRSALFVTNMLSMLNDRREGELNRLVQLDIGDKIESEHRKAREGVEERYKKKENMLFLQIMISRAKMCTQISCWLSCILTLRYQVGAMILFLSSPFCFEPYCTVLIWKWEVCLPEWISCPVLPPNFILVFVVLVGCFILSKTPLGNMSVMSIGVLLLGFCLRLVPELRIQVLISFCFSSFPILFVFIFGNLIGFYEYGNRKIKEIFSLVVFLVSMMGSISSVIVVNEIK